MNYEDINKKLDELYKKIEKLDKQREELIKKRKLTEESKNEIRNANKSNR